MKITYGGRYVFPKLSWAITFLHGVVENPKIYRDFPEGEAVSVYSIFEEESESDSGFQPEFEVIESFELDGETYARIEAKGRFYWIYTDKEATCS